MIELEAKTDISYTPKRHIFDWRGYVAFAVHKKYENDKVIREWKKNYVQWHMVRADLKKIIPYLIAPFAYLFGHLPQLAPIFVGAIALDSVNNGDTQGSVVVVTWSHVCTGSNLGLAITGGSDSTGRTTSAKYNSVSMTRSSENDNGASTVSVFTLTSPTSGSNTAEYRVSGGANPPFIISGASISFTGFDSVGNTASNDNTGTSISTTLNVSRANSYSIESQSPGAGTTQTNGQTVFGGVSGLTFVGAYKLQTSTGNTSLGFSHAGSLSNQQAIVEMRGAAVAAATGNFFLLF